MNRTFLRAIEIENYGKFYEPAVMHFNDRLTTMVLGASKGKSTFVNALEFLSEAVLDGNIKNRWSNVCKTFVNKPKNFMRVEIVLEIKDTIHNGVYRYGMSITDIGVISEFLCKENSGRRVFYRYKNDLDLSGLNSELCENIHTNLTADKPILYLIKEHGSGVNAYFVRFFKRLWVIRAGGLSYRLTPSHLFIKSFFAQRSKVERCCDFLRIFDSSISGIIRVKNTSKVYIVRKNAYRYEYPVPLAKESDTLIKLLTLYRAFDALSPDGGTVITDFGGLDLPGINPDRLKRAIDENIDLIFCVSDDRICDQLKINKTEFVEFCPKFNEC